MNRRPAKHFAIGLALSLLSSAVFALGLEQKGQPEAQLSTMPNYGMEVPSRSALKTVIPAGWQLFVHQSAKLPETMSWKLGDPWPRVLAELAQQNKLSVLLDWEERTVLIRTEDVAVEERATRQEIAQAAVTPLPKFEEALTSKQAEKRDEKKAQRAKQEQQLAAAKPHPAVQPPQSESARMAAEEARRQAELATVAVHEAANTKALPVIRTNPTPQMVTAQQAAAAKNPAKLASTSEFSYTQPVALNRPAARKVAQSIANKYNMRLVWAAHEFNLQGPVTLLARNAEEDARLLEKAIGVYGPVVIEVAANEKVIRVLPRALARTGQPATAVAVLPTASIGASADAATPAVEILAAAPAPTPLPEKANTAASTPKPAAPKLVLSLAEKEPLEDALVRFTRSQGYTLEWKVEGGFEANRAMAFEGESLVQVLSQMLPPLGVSADVYTRDKHIVVRPGEARDR